MISSLFVLGSAVAAFAWVGRAEVSSSHYVGKSMCRGVVDVDRVGLNGMDLSAPPKVLWHLCQDLDLTPPLPRPTKNCHNDAASSCERLRVSAKVGPAPRHEERETNRKL